MLHKEQKTSQQKTNHQKGPLHILSVIHILHLWANRCAIIWARISQSTSEYLTKNRKYHNLLLGLIALLASPPFYLFPAVSFVIFKTWQAAKQEETDLAAGLRMLWFYGGYALAMFHWFAVPMTIDQQHWVLIPIALFSMAFGFSVLAAPALIPAIIIARRAKLKPIIEYLLVSTGWFLADWIRAHLLCGGMPWQTSGLLFSATSGTLRLAGFFRQWQLDFLAALIFCSPILAYRITKERKDTEANQQSTNERTKVSPFINLPKEDRANIWATATTIILWAAMYIGSIPFWMHKDKAATIAVQDKLRVTNQSETETENTTDITNTTNGITKDAKGAEGAERAESHNKPKGPETLFEIYGLQGNIPQKLVYVAMGSASHREVILEQYNNIWNNYKEGRLHTTGLAEDRTSGTKKGQTTGINKNLPRILTLPEGAVVSYRLGQSPALLSAVGSMAATATDGESFGQSTQPLSQTLAGPSAQEEQNEQKEQNGGNLVLFSSIAIDGPLGELDDQEYQGEATFYNATSAVREDGTLMGLYPKKYLVPFGEYIPARRFMPRWLESVIGLGDLSPARNPKVVKHIVFQGVRIATVICYEIAFDNNLLDEDGRKPDLVISLANDGWVGKSLGIYQHMAFAKLRAAMMGVPIFHIVNNGSSAVINKHGRVLSGLPFNQTGVMKARVVYISHHDSNTGAEEYILEPR